jgi:transcriptional regulator with XRE-family HTH domain
MADQTPESIAFGRAIRTERRAREMTQEKLGSRAGVSSRHLSEIERGNVEPRRHTIAALEKALDLPPGKLMGRSDEEGGGR